MTEDPGRRNQRCPVARRPSRRAWRVLATLALGVTPALALYRVPPAFSHVFVIVMEHRSTQQVIGNPQFPALNRLAKEGALATNYHGITPPSLTNDVALIAGRTSGSHSDDPRQSLRGPTIADELEQAGLSWKDYFQSLPHAGFSGASGGPFQVYVKRHNPFMLFPAIANTPRRAALSVPLSQLAQDLRAGQVPNFALIVPDTCHDLHGNINCLSGAKLAANTDAFVAQWVKAIRASSAWDERAAIVITFDEPHGRGGGRTPLLVLTKDGPHGLQNGRDFNHDSLLRTLTNAWRLAPLGESGMAPPMNELFFNP